MTKKSMAKVKAVNNVNSSKFAKQLDLPPIEETFDNIKQVMVNTAKVQIRVAERVENLANLRNAAYKFWGNELDNKYLPAERMKYFIELMNLSVKTYEQILECVEGFELDEFLKGDMKDYFESIIPSIDDVKTEEELFAATIVSDCVRPWGEKMTQLHHQILDEQGKRKAQEAEELNL